jgi:hypothetical protein
VGNGKLTTDDALARLRAVIAPYLWPAASQRHGKLVAELLAPPLLYKSSDGGRAAELGREWQALRDRPPSELAVDRGVWMLSALAEICGDADISRGARRLWEEKLESIIGRPPYPYADDGWDHWF